MDGGMQDDADARPVTVDAVFKDGLVPERVFTPAECIGIMDRLLVLESAWWNGALLPSTLFTCMYAVRMDACVDATLLIFLTGLLKASEAIQVAVSRADVYLDEEFITSTYGLLLFDVDAHADVDVAALLATAEEEARRVGKADKSHTDEEAAVAKASRGVAARLGLRRALLQLTEQLLARELGPLKKTIAFAREQLVVIKATAALGQCPDGIFFPDIHNASLSSSPPRPLTLPTMDEVVVRLSAMLDDTHALRCIDGHVSSLDGLTSFIRTWAARSPNVVLRSFALPLIIEPRDRMVLGRFKLSSLLSGQLPQVIHPLLEVVRQTGAEGAEEHLVGRFESLVRKATMAQLSGVRALFVHPAGQQKKLKRAFRRDLLTLVDECASLDGELAMVRSSQGEPEPLAPILAPFALQVALPWAQDYVKLDFPLGLIAEWEMRETYWILAILFLLGFKMESRRLTNDAERERAAAKGKGKGKAKGKKKKGKAAADESHDENAPPPPSLTLFMLEVQHTMAKATYRLLLLLEQMHMREADVTPFGVPADRFYHRFGALTPLVQGAFPISYAAFEKDVESAAATSRPALIKHVDEGFAHAQRLARSAQETFAAQFAADVIGSDRKNELEAICKVAAGNRASLALAARLASAASEDARGQLLVAFDVHSTWPVVQCKPPAKP